MGLSADTEKKISIYGVEISSRKEVRYSRHLFKRCTRANNTLDFQVLRAVYLKYSTAKRS